MSAPGPSRTRPRASYPSAFDVFTQDKQDAWIGGLQAKIARALGGAGSVDSPYGDAYARELSPLRAVTPDEPEDPEPEPEEEGSLFGDRQEANGNGRGYCESRPGVSSQC
jgi:hypothetical protein